MDKQPKVFISYSWEDEEHKIWVKNLAERLLFDGIEAIIDQYDLTPGDRIPHFMEQSINNSDYVLIICTPNYKEKSDKRTGGVGYEGHIISGEILSRHNERKFIPVIRKGTVSTAIPTFLSGKLAIDLVSTKDYENNYRDLITTIFGMRKKPVIGNAPSYISSDCIKSSDISSDEPIHILGIITDEVTVPKMDGSKGSALYKIPFRLSKCPSSIWCKLFIQTWNNPPRITTMHRFGIASIYGDKVILNGTTIEEVRDYHRETLILCVNIANQKEQEILAEQQRQKNLEKQKKLQHYSTINSIADDIKF